MKQSTTIMLVISIVVLLGIGFVMMNSNTQTTKQIDPQQDITPKADTEAPVMTQKNIVQIASENGNFNTLVAAVKAAGLAETLSGPGPFTVFAPTDEAFAKLPAGTVDALLKDKEKLTKILTYHVIAGKVLASDVVKLTSAKTVQGQEVKISVEAGTVMIDNAKVVITDILGSNGVIHVIDSVILPK